MKKNNVSLLIAITAISFLSFNLVSMPVYAAASVSNQNLQQQLKILQQKVTSLEATSRKKPARQTATTSSSSQFTLLNNKLDKILQVLQINGNNVTIKSPRKLKLESGSDTSIRAGKSLLMESASDSRIKASTSLKLESSTTTAIKGSIIKLNNGSKAVAKIGSNTIGNSNSQKIINGSPTILVP